MPSVNALIQLTPPWNSCRKYETCRRIEAACMQACQTALVHVPYAKQRVHTIFRNVPDSDYSFSKRRRSIQECRQLVPPTSSIGREETVSNFAREGVDFGDMQYQTLGQSDLRVSRMCLGTMTFGEGNSYHESCRLLNMALEAGVNFLDTAEMYPVPQTAGTQGLSEEFVGRWLREAEISRDRIIIASKVAGPSGQMEWIRGGPHSLSAQNIRSAIDSSLLRLGVDCIDLYQIHWPDRYVPMFGDTEYDVARRYSSVVTVEEQLKALGRAVLEGKIRYVGLSNETPWGLMKFCHVAPTQASPIPTPPHDSTHITPTVSSALPTPSSPHPTLFSPPPPLTPTPPSPNPSQIPRIINAQPSPFPRIISLQNAYSLLCRTFESGLAECCAEEGVSLLAYSPLAMGLLTNKYFTPGGAGPGARLIKYRGRYAEAEGRYPLENANVRGAVEGYAGIARRWGVTPVELSLGFVLRNPLVGSVVVGATDEEQLGEVLGACRVRVTDEMLEEIEGVHRMYPNPTP